MDKSSQFTQMTIAQQSLNAGPAPSEQSLRAFDGVNFFVGGALAGFGPFVTAFSASKIGAKRTSALS